MTSTDYPFIVFDWDGTLMDSVGRIVSSMQNAAIEASIAPPTPEATKSIIGMSLDAAIKVLFPTASTADHNTVLANYRYQYIEGNDTPSALFEGTERLLLELKRQGRVLSVATGKSRRGLDRAFGMTNVEHLFSASICADEAESKPSPDMLNQLISLHQCAPQQMLMVGDAVFDLAMANSAGVDAVGVSYGVGSHHTLSEHKPKAIVDDLEGLYNLLLD